jgi:hypothetical protein
VAQVFPQLRCSLGIVKNKVGIAALKVAYQTFNGFFRPVPMFKYADQFVDMLRAADFLDAQRMIVILPFHFLLLI